MKPGRLFKLSKQSKRSMAVLPKDRRDVFKKLMIEAELASLVVPRRERKQGTEDAGL
jgi:hypothetical protein